jgi:hypothetical protein
MTSYIPFWSNDPTVLFNKKHILELFPLQDMTFDEKLNAISRLIILLCILGFMLTRSYRFLLNGAIALLIIYIMYKTQKQLIVSELTKKNDKEGFANKKNNNNKSNMNSDNTIDASVKIINPETLKSYLKSDFEEVNKNNPLGNVLLTEIMDNPKRKPAPPSFSTEVYEDISDNTKRMIQTLNPGIQSTNKQFAIRRKGRRRRIRDVGLVSTQSSQCFIAQHSYEHFRFIITECRILDTHSFSFFTRV